MIHQADMTGHNHKHPFPFSYSADPTKINHDFYKVGTRRCRCNIDDEPVKGAFYC